MLDPISELLLTELSIDDMKTKLIDKYNGSESDSLIIAQEMSNSEWKISKKETVDFSKLFVLQNDRYLPAILDITGGYRPSELADLFQKYYWRGNCDRTVFEQELENEKTERGTVAVRISTEKPRPRERRAFVVGIKLDKVTFYKFHQDNAGFLLVKHCLVSGIPITTEETNKKYRLLQDLIYDLSTQLGYPTESKTKSIETIPSEDFSETCIICMSSKRNTLLIPCKHLNLCGTCSNKVDSCPICRKPIESRIYDIYVS